MLHHPEPGHLRMPIAQCLHRLTVEGEQCVEQCATSVIGQCLEHRIRLLDLTHRIEFT